MLNLVISSRWKWCGDFSTYHRGVVDWLAFRLLNSGTEYGGAMFIGSFLGLRAFIFPPFVTGCQVPVLESCFCVGGKKGTLLVPSLMSHQISKGSPLSSGNAGFSSVPEDRLSISFSRSSGAGGQNVNKVSTKVEVRFNLNEADWLENDVRERLRTQLASRLTRNGDIVFTSQEHRTQLLNKATAIAKVRCMFFLAFSCRPSCLLMEDC